MELSVYWPHPPEPGILAELHARLDPGVHLSLGPSLPVPADYQILIAGRPGREQFTASPNLRALIVPWAGIPEQTRTLLREFPNVALHNLHHNALPVAETAVALLLTAAKCLLPADRALRRGDWSPRYAPSRAVLLAGKTALVLGYGAIGQQAAQLCRGLGMHVVATRRNVSPSNMETPDEIHPPEALHALLGQADALLICLPLTPETEGLIGARELALLPPQAVLVNVGRGAIVDEAALYTALRDGTLYAAGLDVWYNYPQDEGARSRTSPSARPFHELDNVVMSPHRASATRETEQLRMQHLAGALNAAARGEPLPHRVDLAVGY